MNSQQQNHQRNAAPPGTIKGKDCKDAADSWRDGAAGNLLARQLARFPTLQPSGVLERNDDYNERNNDEFIDSTVMRATEAREVEWSKIEGNKERILRGSKRAACQNSLTPEFDSGISNEYRKGRGEEDSCLVGTFRRPLERELASNTTRWCQVVRESIICR